MSILGKGIFKGLGVTLKNFALSYFDRGRKERLPTIQYPEEGTTVTPFSRNFPFLIFDGKDEIDGMRCVACQICERECPPACIYIVKEKDENGKFVKRPKVFDVDVSVCMGCQICVEVCPFDAIVMDSEFEYSNEDRFGSLLFNRDQLLKSNDYYHSIHPDEARDRDAHLAEKKAAEEAKKKAREEKAKQAAAEKEAQAAAEKEAAPKQEPSTEEQEPEATTKRKDASPARDQTHEAEAKGSGTSDSKPAAEALETSSPALADSAESQSPEFSDGPPRKDEPEEKEDAP